MTSHHAATWVCVGLLLAALSADRALAAEADTYEFAVIYDGKTIGSHTYEVIHNPAATRVRSDATFKVKLLFVTVYKYRHQANELWQNGCLTALKSATDDNGEHFQVHAHREDAGLLLNAQVPDQDGDGGQSQLLDSACPGSFAYWDRARLERGSLINAQTGENVASVLTFEGTEPVDGTPARRYRLEPRGMSTIRLWYGEADDRWLKLETQRDDATLTYRLVRSEQRTVSWVDEDAGVEDPVGI